MATDCIFLPLTGHVALTFQGEKLTHVLSLPMHDVEVPGCRENPRWRPNHAFASYGTGSAIQWGKIATFNSASHLTWGTM